MAQDKNYKLTAVIPSVRSMITGNIISHRHMNLMACDSFIYI